MGNLNIFFNPRNLILVVLYYACNSIIFPKKRFFFFFLRFQILIMSKNMGHDVH